MVVLCCIVVVTGFLPSPVSRSSLSSPPSQVNILYTYLMQYIHIQIYEFKNWSLLLLDISDDFWACPSGW